MSIEAADGRLVPGALVHVDTGTGHALFWREPGTVTVWALAGGRPAYVTGEFPTPPLDTVNAAAVYAREAWDQRER